MKKKYKGRSIIALLLAVFIITVLPVCNVSAAGSNSTNRFNVVMVVDASNSMNYTDPSELRFEAIQQFTTMLAEEGNYLGGVVFANKVEVKEAPSLVSKDSDKQSMLDKLKSFMSKEANSQVGYTNIGDGLLTATNMLVDNGNPDLPSVIVFLSDGNTEMPTNDELTTSLDAKADAIQKARDNDIAIYSVCLNANSKADISEMKQISKATGGVFEEVKKPEDLKDVFNTFYNLIYGTSTIILADDVFPASGKLEAEFEVPGIGVEEVNIVVYGKTTNVTLFDPNGEKSDATVTKSNTFTMVKLTDVVPGKWKLVAEGNPGDSIKINMVYNTNLDIEVTSDPSFGSINPEDAIEIDAYLKSDGKRAADEEQYVGYTAELQVMNGYGDLITTIPMEIDDDHFEVEQAFDEGTYYFNVKVSGNHIEKTSDSIGPLYVSLSEPTERMKSNMPPEPVENPYEITVTLWPFKDNSYTFDMTKLAVDDPEDELRYRIVSSSFVEDDDYTVDGNNITVKHYSLSKGAFTISATDSMGLSCDIEVIIKSINVGLITLIAIGFAAVVGLIVFIAGLWVAFTKPFRGTITAQSYSNGSYKGNSRTKMRGRIKLSAFQMDPIGLDYNKCYFQATGQQFVYLVTNKPVIWNGQETKKVRIQSGAEVSIKANEADSRMMYVRFESRMTGRAPSRSGRRKPSSKRR